MRSLFLLISCICLAQIQFSSCLLREAEGSSLQARVFYVAVNGDDGWSGTLPAPVRSGDDGPFATLQRARDEIKELKRRGSQGAFTVFVRGGTYRLHETLRFGPEDSGTKSAPTVFKSFAEEHPVLSGSEKIERPEPYKKGIYRADMSSMDILQSFRQIFIDGKRQVLARYPNVDERDPAAAGYLYVAGRETSRGEFGFKADKMRTWTHPEDAEVVIFPGPNYTSETIPVYSIDLENRIVRLRQKASYDIIAGNRFYFQNIFEELDSPGEWYFDRRDKALYFRPQAGDAPASATVPVINSLIEIKAKKLFDKYSVAPAYIEFEGFTLEESEGSAIVVSGARNIAVRKCTIHNVGGYGIEIHDGAQNAALGNDIYEVGAGGIMVSAGDGALSPGANRIENNYIHNTGVYNKTAGGIECRGTGNIVSHNLIRSTPRAGIWFDGNDHVIEYNHVHHVNRETQDSGIIYSSQIDWTKRGNVIRFNYLHDSGGYGRGSAADAWHTPFETYGIYLDDWTSGTEVYGNIVADTESGAIFVHGGRDNMVENNIILEGGRLGQMLYSEWPSNHPTALQWLPRMYAKVRETGFEKYPLLSTIKDIRTGASMSGNHFVRNIVYYLRRDSVLYGVFHGLDVSSTVSDYNVIYHRGFSLLIPYAKEVPARQWSAWRSKGLDQHSVIADPLFKDIPAGDFTLSSSSPALKMGFVPIPFDKIGPYKDPLRASWPILE